MSLKSKKEPDLFCYPMHGKFRQNALTFKLAKERVVFAINGNLLQVKSAQSSSPLCNLSGMSFNLASSLSLLKTKSLGLNCKSVNSIGALALCTDEELQTLNNKYFQKTQKSFESILSNAIGPNPKPALLGLMMSALADSYPRKKFEREVLKDLDASAYIGIEKDSWSEGHNTNYGDSYSGWSRSLSISNCKDKICDYEVVFTEDENGKEASRTVEHQGKVKLLSNIEAEFIPKGNESESCVHTVLDSNYPGSAILQPKEKNEDCEKHGLRFVAGMLPRIYKASFNCLAKNLTPLESFICHDFELATLDLELNDIYQRAKQDKKFKDFVASQNEWIQFRNSQKVSKRDIKFAYEKRILEFLETQ